MDRPDKPMEKHTNNIFSFGFSGGFTSNFSKKPIPERPTPHPDAAETPIAYVTNFSRQGLTARLVYLGKDDKHIHELHCVDAGQWHWTDLSANAAKTPIAYVTDFPGQGPTARVVYLGNDQHIHELSFKD